MTYKRNLEWWIWKYVSEGLNLKILNIAILFYKLLILQLNEQTGIRLMPQNSLSYPNNVELKCCKYANLILEL